MRNVLYVVQLKIESAERLQKVIIGGIQNAQSVIYKASGRFAKFEIRLDLHPRTVQKQAPSGPQNTNARAQGRGPNVLRTRTHMQTRRYKRSPLGNSGGPKAWQNALS